jgi:phosphoribosylformylglycinamidine synthase
MSRPIYPTPVIGVVGLLEDASLAVTAGFKAAGDEVFVAGAGPVAVDGSEYQKVVLGTVEGRIPDPDLANEARLHDFLASAAEARLLASAHDVSDGGLAVAVAEAAIAGGIGVTAAEAGDLFAEGEGRAVISVAPEHVAAVRALAGEFVLTHLGTVGGGVIAIGEAQLGIEEATEIHSSAIPHAMGETE